jgi:hypothetical protein
VADALVQKKRADQADVRLRKVAEASAGMLPRAPAASARPPGSRQHPRYADAPSMVKMWLMVWGRIIPPCRARARLP